MAPRSTSTKTRTPYYKDLEALYKTVLDAAPSGDVIKEWAVRYPDKYGSLVGALTRALDAQLPMKQLRADQMSDSQVEDRMYESVRELVETDDQLREVIANLIGEITVADLRKSNGSLSAPS